MNSMSKNNDQLINEIIGLMRADESVDAPVTAIRRSKSIFRIHAATTKKSVVERVLAVLQIDLSPNQAVFGERSAASGSQARQMLFQAGENALDIRIVKAEGSFDLHGQVLGEGFADCALNLGSFAATANEASEFKFARIPAGKYDLILRSGGKEIRVILELK